MMILRSAPPSPFGRKVKIAARLLGFWDRIEVVNADTTSESDELRRQNPLGKIPTLILEDGTAIYDSLVILDHLDAMAGGGRLLPREGMQRTDVLTRHALADGVMEAALLMVYEARWRPEERRSAEWLAHQDGKVRRGLAAFEAAPPAFGTMPGGLPDIAAIGLACALGYLDLRFAGEWRRDHPGLVAWLDAFSAAFPAYEATRPVV